VTLSLEFKREASAQHSADAGILLLTIASAELPEPLRLSNDPTARLSIRPLRYGTKSRGETYYFAPMTIVHPDDPDDGSQRSRLAISNIVGRDEDGSVVTVIDIVESTVARAEVLIEVVLKSNPDVVDTYWTELLTADATFDAAQVSLDLAVDGNESEPFPAGRCTPGHTPTLFD